MLLLWRPDNPATWSSAWSSKSFTPVNVRRSLCISSLAHKKTGKLVGLKANFLVDHGAYGDLADLLLTRGNQFIGSGYHIDNVRNHGEITTTNHAYGAAFRGYGSPQSLFATESIIDEMARKLGEDPFEFRMKNLYTPESTTPYGDEPDLLPYTALMDMRRP